ncbi:dTDP-glucose 4,6-dehydratase [Patescibacteria group bacterium]|nr:dTDP-glucose 4,6-dehydratase [Patescibacteria group bacterium]MCL5091656.1 dTDP-glucose 4,6-dehydratase [Patescibacteria group bacterium]
MKILVTGGAGFIGANFIIYWLKRHPHDQIINLDKLTYAGNLENLSGVENNPHYRFVHGDICDRPLVDRLVAKVDVILHFAAESHVDRSIIDPAPFVKTNIEGTYVLLEAARKNGKKRFHHISTDEVFGALPLNTAEKFTPQTPYRPHSPYSASKAASDHLVRAYHDTFALPITISNCSNNFGPYQFPEKLIALAVTNLIEDKSVPVYGDGLYVRDWLYVEDHCEAIDLIVHKGTIGETYLLGALSDQSPQRTNLDIIKQIIKMMGKEEGVISFVQDRPGHDRRYAIDWSATAATLGWRPRHRFDEALQLTLAWYQDHQNWWKRVKTGAYRDYYQKQYQS